MESLSPIQIGERLRLAREAKGLTQAQAAESISISRTTLIAIEQGQRRIRMGEIQGLSHRYQTTANALLRLESTHVDFTPRFRKLSTASGTAVETASTLLSNLVKAESELENLLGVKRTNSYPPERPILPGDVAAQAERDALELRENLGLSTGPIPDIFSIIEFDLNVRLYIRKFDSRISGLFAYDESVGPCMLLNGNHPREKRAQTASHECGHFISTRRNVDSLDIDSNENFREERYANAFSRALLTPARAVSKKFQEVTAGADRLSRRHVIILAHYFSVSREAIVRRLEELKIVKPSTWNWFEANGGITNDQARQVIGDATQTDAIEFELSQPTTLRLQLLASEAYRRKLISEGQLANLLYLDRVELRTMLEDSQMGDSDDALKFLD